MESKFTKAVRSGTEKGDLYSIYGFAAGIAKTFNEKI